MSANIWVQTSTSPEISLRRINMVRKIQMSVFIKIEFKFIMVACDVFSLYVVLLLVYLRVVFCLCDVLSLVKEAGF